jgi:hypothetical protein
VCILSSRSTWSKTKYQRKSRRWWCAPVLYLPPMFSWMWLISNANDILLFFREKLKMKEREEAWVKIENLAKANPQVLKNRITWKCWGHNLIALWDRNMASPGKRVSLTLYMKMSAIKHFATLWPSSCISTSFAPQHFYHRINFILFLVNKILILRVYCGKKKIKIQALLQDYNLFSCLGVIDAVTQTMFPFLFNVKF